MTKNVCYQDATNVFKDIVRTDHISDDDQEFNDKCEDALGSSGVLVDGRDHRSESIQEPTESNDECKNADKVEPVNCYDHKNVDARESFQDSTELL